MDAPAPKVMGAENDPWWDALCDPGLGNEVADVGGHTDEIWRVDAQLRSILRMDPDRIAVADLVQPFGIAAASMDQRRQTECGDKDELPLLSVDRGPVHVAAGIIRDRLLRPAPVFERPGVELEPAGRR